MPVKEEATGGNSARRFAKRQSYSDNRHTSGRMRIGFLIICLLPETGLLRAGF
jgi:hypothetical protein